MVPAEAPREVVERLAKRYKAMKGAMRALDEQAMALVTRWQWTTGDYYTLRPLYHERFGVPRGRLLPDDPNKAGDVWLFGFDAQERMLTRCLYRRFAAPDDADYMLYDDEGIEVVRYANSHFGTKDDYMMRSLGRLRGDPRQPEWYCEVEGMFGSLRVEYEHYRYEGERLVEVQLQRRASLDADAPAHPQTHYISYSANGKPSVEIDDPYRRSVELGYEAVYGIKSGANSTIPPAQIVDALKGAAIDAVRAQQSHLQGVGTFCWLSLDYDAVADPGMVISLGTAAQRADFAADTYDRSFIVLLGHYVGAGAQMQMLTVDPLPVQVDAFIEERREDQDWKAVRALFRAAAQALNAYDWRILLDVTEDFIVFASDREAMDDTEEDILECAPESKIALWRADGWFS
jgi:hypothetical protein